MASRQNVGRTQAGRKRYTSAMMIPEDRIAWTNLYSATISVDKYEEAAPDEAEGNDPEPGPGVSLRIGSSFEGGRITKLILSHYTEPELDAFYRIITLAVEAARPTVIMRDQNAREALERGDSHYARSYRDVPRVVERSGPSG